MIKMYLQHDVAMENYRTCTILLATIGLLVIIDAKGNGYKTSLFINEKRFHKKSKISTQLFSAFSNL
jgi:hypothetical protein